ncbi:hypothetical protein PVAP13_8KG057052 [Panicum virgatum]|uniref:Uncharacterized protein n=1 Tax=Panicum virgatum TaxID=38727 RepID=A0A8T0PFG0_PANVG|nr:hypothetical protein PVAP13_8KG057052 [Panicum virgatum]
MALFTDAALSSPSLIYRRHQGTSICDPHDGDPSLVVECWYNCTLEDIAGEDKKRRLPEGTGTNNSVVQKSSSC